MNDVRYKWILYGIVFVILATIGIQVYWNYKNYLNSKQQLVNDVQTSLDKAVDDYYAHLAKKSTVDIAFKHSDSGKLSSRDLKLDSIIGSLNLKGRGEDSINVNLIKGVTLFREFPADSVLEFGFRKTNDSTIEKSANNIFWKYSGHEFINQKKQDDSLRRVKFRTLTSKVVISLSNDSLSLKFVDSLLRIDLRRKNIGIHYGLNYRDITGKFTTFNDFKLPENKSKKDILHTKSESTFLPMGSSLSIFFTNETKILLKRILGGILISFLLVLAVISSLFYLLHIIKHQKQLAEVKNDLISNITHEFKTPIATIGVAIESIKDFNVIEDKDKTKTYLELSSGQLSKLNVMVEKLLETATLDSDDLTLNKSSEDIVDLVKAIVDKHQMQSENKTIFFSSSSDSITALVDVFHFENAINNVLDNALKYGGDDIKVSVEQNSIAFTVSIADNGNCISKANKGKIFEKFYRIPRGNTHDVKGFGIGLYYTKKIVEKHGGAIHLDLEKNQTDFKLSFPNE